MKISYNWLKEFVDCSIGVDELCTVFPAIGIEVASTQKRSIPSGIMVAHIVSLVKHPRADKLTVCTVDVGGGQPLQVVCGAPNAVAGMKGALATIGTALSDTMVIQKVKIRGEESNGMFCSERELGISDNHEGIIHLPQELQTGAILNTIIPDDTIIEVELTPNRGDCLSMLGIAREVAAYLGKPLKDYA